MQVWTKFPGATTTVLGLATLVIGLISEVDWALAAVGVIMVATGVFLLRQRSGQAPNRRVAPWRYATYWIVILIVVTILLVMAVTADAASMQLVVGGIAIGVIIIATMMTMFARRQTTN